ncbi:MAG: hypothetical protein M3R02_08135 [Chloroflexota bacterium]|nr:hypothetical protein [Chloroflexota bacterium]
MKVGPRLAKLEARVPVGCGVCRTWWEVVLRDDEGNRDRPERCPGCGRVVPIRLLLHIVGVPLDAW